ncbi:MAG: aminopeptidase PepB [Gammaproteobacteria bacterium]|nr:aminopeptidase PepB [Gammaproteobacteria bacterium]
MATSVSVQLSMQAADEAWGKNPVLSAAGEGFRVHAGDKAAERLRRIQQAGRRLGALGLPSVALAGEGWDLEAQWALYQGFTSAKNLDGVAFAPLPEAESAELRARRHNTAWLRRMVNGTPEDIAPLGLCEAAAGFLSELAPGKVSHRIVSGEALREGGYAGLWNVGRGSSRPPALLILDFNPSGEADAPVAAALVGKGITFDSGGYSLKESLGMLTMKCDMGGAATVTAGLGLAIARGLNKRVQLFLCCAENLVSGHAYKLGDILSYRNGVSVEIVNTDAEGRLVLADGLLDAAASGAPLVIDAATLTGAAVTALGTDYNAVFSLDEGMREAYLGHGRAENERHWALPLEGFHQSACPSPYADTANSKPVKGGGAGGASNAAGFLSRFVANEGQGWVHVDLAGAFADSDNGLWGAGATALGFRTIARALLEA